MPYQEHPFKVALHRRLDGRTDIPSVLIIQAGHAAAKAIWEKDHNPRFDKDYNMTVQVNGMPLWLAWEFMQHDSGPVLLMKNIKRGKG